MESKIFKVDLPSIRFSLAFFRFYVFFFHEKLCSFFRPHFYMSIVHIRTNQTAT